jgi:signal transduction histidine kinase
MLRIDRLRRGSADPQTLRDGLDTAKQQVSRLDALVGRLLDVSRLATGNVELVKESVDLGETVREVAGRMQDEATRASCSVELEIQKGVVGAWDRLRIEQVVTNLLSNALKYGAGKRVQLKVEGEVRWGRFSVSDGGIGISEESLERIFGRFERAAPSSRYGGLGLGLYVVAQIVEAHGGRVRAVSRPGCGATFIVELPMTVTDTGESQPTRTESSAPNGASGTFDSESAIHSRAS